MVPSRDGSGAMRPSRARRRLAAALTAGLAAGGLYAPGAQAFRFETGNPELKVSWDNTVKYSLAARLRDADQDVAASFENPNVDFGDLALDRGLINNRFDLLSEFDLAYRNVGFRVSGAAWYDTVYMRSHNDYPDSIGIPNTQAALAGGRNDRNSGDVKDLMGRKAEFLDAFVYGSAEVGGGAKLSGRAGKHTQLYGETLFLGANGIAYAQGPVDLVKAFSLPNAQFKEIAMPVGQVSGNLQLSPDFSIGAYVQYDWKPIRLPAAGSYYSPADFVGEGADLLLTPFGAANRVADQKGSDSGQFGARLKFRVGDYDLGVYGARFHEKLPIPVLDATLPGRFGGGAYRLAYARDIDVYGLSVSTVIGETNVAAEMSTRRNTPLAPLGDLIIATTPGTDNKRNTPYARGNTFHLNLSAITVLAANPLWEGASFVGEFAYNRLLDVRHNPVNALGLTALNTTHTRDHGAFRFVFQPEYFQVLPGVDLQVPIGVGYGLFGRSAVFQLAPEHGGDISIGVNANIRNTWRASLNVTHYFGSAGPAPSLPATGPKGSYASYKQYYADRDYVSISIQRTF